MKESEYYKLLEDPQARKQMEDAFLNDPHIISVITHAEETMPIARQSIPDAMFHAKWTCEGCGQRITSEHRDVFHYSWHHQDCGEITLTINGDLGYSIGKPISIEEARIRYAEGETVITTQPHPEFQYQPSRNETIDGNNRRTT